MTVRTAWDGRATLGEGPAWDATAGALWFVDIKARLVHRYRPEDHRVESWKAPTQVGWVVPAADGRVLAGLQTGLARFNPSDGSFTHLATVEPELPGNRLNDAAVGPDGCLWFGSMDDGHEKATGRIYRWDGAVVTLVSTDPVPITNGPAISPDGGTLYHVDTAGGVIHSAGIVDGDVEPSRPFARIDPADGHPDGVTVDAAGNVWVGLWGGWRARRYSPDGVVNLEVALPAANVTKIALGGPDLRTAYATTAAIGTDAEEQPEAGNLFTFEVDIPGQPGALARVPT